MTGHTSENQNSEGFPFGLLTILISWLVYILHICPTIYWRDSAEFVTAGYTLGVPHPAGSPTYSLITKLFTFIPVGSIAFRVNLVSAFFGALSIYLLYRVARVLIRTLAPGGGNARLAEYSSFAAAMLFLFSATFWRFSEVAEVYTQQIFWLLLVILLLLRANEAEAVRGKYLAMAALFYGLSLGTHAVMGFYLPAILLFLFLVDRSRLTEARKLGPIIFFLLLGVSVYLYVPLRSYTDPWLDWGNPQTAKKLLYHLIDKKDATSNLAVHVNNLGFQLKNYASMLPKQITYFGLLLAAVGFVVNLKNRKSWWLLSLIFFIHFAFFVRTWRADFGFIPTFTILTLWAGVGLYWIAVFLCGGSASSRSDAPLRGGGGKRLPRAAALLYMLMGVTVFFSAWGNRPYADKSGYYSTHRFGKYLLGSVAYKGVLLDQYAWFQTLYLQAVENSRPDVSSILRNAFAFPDFFYRVDNRKFPLLRIPEQEAGGSPFRFMMNTIEANIDRLPIYWYQVDKLAPLKRMVPRGMVFQVFPEGMEPTTDDLNEHVKKLYRFMETEFGDPYFWEDEEGRKVYSLNLTGLAMYFLQNGRSRHAHLMQRLAYQVDPESPSVVNNYGVLYEYLGQIEKAEEMYRKGAELEPGDPSIRANLGVTLYKQEKDREAVEQFNRVLRMDPYDQVSNYHLGLLALEEGDRGGFVRRMAAVLQDNIRSKVASKARARLREYRRGELRIPAKKP
jgi:tetratricopeptide (TPR) repeat protein